MTGTGSREPGEGWPAWYALAECACRGLDTALFFPSSTDSARWDQRVRDACAACPVRAECLTWALEHGEHGIWADTDEHARARTRRTLRRHRR
ncbi:MAG: WhiB family transcriptional regulator [Egibacteraceae bacterium]